MTVSDACPVKSFLRFDDQSNCKTTTQWSQDTGSYHDSWQYPMTPGNKSASDNDTETLSPWQYQSWPSYIIPPLMGRHGWYDNGGYVFPLGLNRSLGTLRDDDWVDPNTRVVLIELSVFNPGFGFYTNLVLFFEFIDVSTIAPSFQIYTAQLYILQDLRDIGYSLCALVAYGLIMLRTWRILQVVPQRLRQGRVFIPFAIVVDLCVIIIANCALACYALKHAAIVEARVDIETAGSSGFVNLYSLIFVDKVLTLLLATEISVACIKALKLLDLNIWILLMSVTMKSALWKLSRIAPWVVASAVAFIMVTVTTMGPSCRDYRDASAALVSVANLCLFEPSHGDDCHTYSTVGHVFIALASIALVAIAQPFLRVLFIDAHFDAILDLKRLNRRENEFLDYVWRRLNVWFGWWSANQYKKFLEDQAKLQAKIDRYVASSSRLSLRRNSLRSDSLGLRRLRTL